MFLSLLFTAAFSQQRFSLATNLDVQRNLKKEQLYWAAGHTTQLLFHLTPKEGIYVWFAYYSNGHFNNNVTVLCKFVYYLSAMLASFQIFSYPLGLLTYKSHKGLQHLE